ncbi:malto-oligosyltrehalose trehalohydrolase [Streptomyces sp. RKND-216]|uniref:malto-oligosyltrehalose trehalohydrolase n=1 Tax=Streptomyces sp. RKND-216 TaxID=2562581 RepID=UPI00109E2566|nr:malto-oligosyltrehalose trehalohydrolase [Streptomyces sp. RKND-216]THA23892.1 malto-oligosyltrehalose trehalohydrolase [Streptomyces sp. RKND-216]
MLFEVWAPTAAEGVVLRLEARELPMERDPARPGWWTLRVEAGPGTRYGFALDGGPVLPDPRSRRQPDGPDGLSAVVDPGAYEWRHPWQGRPLAGAVLYELHIGTFTSEGTFDAAAARLPHVARLGVTHVELMPVSPFPGTHGWGYDGVAPWAVHEPYGGPDGLARFADAAHGAGLGVVLDVVHNHLGPSGNHLPAYGPYFTGRHRTPWGDAVNLDDAGSDEVRASLCGSALALLRDFRLDGLRLDAVHTLADDRARHFLDELSAAVDALAAETGRPLFLIAESDRNDPRTTTPRTVHGHGLHAQWNDDFHHALHVALTGEARALYADFARAPMAALAKTLTGGFFHDGSYSSFRGRRHGAPLDPMTPTHRLVGFAQNHDQVGNRAAGDRLAASLSPGLLACAAALVLLSPFTPMLFMGEEWGARTPWLYFTDHTDPDLARAVREGRRAEFAAHGWDGDVADPQAPQTRERSCLDWSEPERDPHAALLAWHQDLIALRRAHPGLAHTSLGAARVTYDEDTRWLALSSGPLSIAVNLHPGETAAVPLPAHLEVLATWSTASQHEDGMLLLPPESAAVLR